MLSHANLDELKRSIRDVAGEESASEILFRLGRMIGSGREAAKGGHLDEQLALGIRELADLGVAGVELEDLDGDGEHFRLVANITVPEASSGAAEAREYGDQRAKEGATCGLAAGFVTGLAAAITGQDLVSDWLDCPTACGTPKGGVACCRFQVRPAHLGPPRGPDGHPVASNLRPQGSARFFLGELGASLGHESISLGDFLQGTSDGVVILDPEQRVRFWNRGAEEMFGYSQEEMIGNDFAAIVPDDLLETGELEWIQGSVSESGSLNNYMTRRLTRAGELLEISLTRTSLRSESGRVLGSIGVLRDLTENLRTEQALIEARHLARIGEMSATVAHDIKNPLAAIYSAVQYLEREETSVEERKELLGEVGKEVRRVDETIQDLLRFARSAPLRREDTRIEDLVRGVLADVKLTAELADHRFEVFVDPDAQVAIDRKMMTRALRNLVVNACQAMEQPGCVTVRAWQDEDLVVLEVLDQGPGIPVEVGAELFEPFVTSKVRGTGLGLAVARRYAEAHGGTLELTESTGDGSTFRISLPGR